jgi:hypothetical protein
LGNRVVTKTRTASAASNGAPCFEIITGSTTKSGGACAATASMRAAEPSAPVFAASTPMSRTQASI